MVVGGFRSFHVLVTTAGKKQNGEVVRNESEKIVECCNFTVTLHNSRWSNAMQWLLCWKERKFYLCYPQDSGKVLFSNFLS